MKERIIKEMPDQETLEAFVEGLSGEVQVYFDKDERIFKWHYPEDHPNYNKDG